MGKIFQLFGTFGPKVLGVLVFIVAVASAGIAMLDNNPATTINLEEILGAATGIGLMNSRGKLETSEQAGAYGPVVQAQAPIIEAEKIVAAEGKSAAKVAAELPKAVAIVAAAKK